jgi:hypothetical protein
MRIAQTHGRELIAGPLVGALHVRRASKTLADRIHKTSGEIHDFGVVETLISNTGDRFEINFLLRPYFWNRKQNHYERTDKPGRPLHDGLS